MRLRRQIRRWNRWCDRQTSFRLSILFAVALLLMVACGRVTWSRIMASVYQGRSSLLARIDMSRRDARLTFEPPAYQGVADARLRIDLNERGGGWRPIPGTLEPRHDIWWTLELQESLLSRRGTRESEAEQAALWLAAASSEEQAQVERILLELSSRPDLVKEALDAGRSRVSIVNYAAVVWNIVYPLTLLSSAIVIPLAMHRIWRSRHAHTWRRAARCECPRCRHLQHGTQAARCPECSYVFTVRQKRLIGIARRRTTSPGSMRDT